MQWQAGAASVSWHAPYLQFSSPSAFRKVGSRLETRVSVALASCQDLFARNAHCLHTPTRLTVSGRAAVGWRRGW